MSRASRTLSAGASSAALLRELTGRALRWLSTPAGLAWLFGVGLVLRLILARGGGFAYDVGTFSAWASRLAEVGPGRFYDDPGFFVDYPPGYLYVLWILGRVARAIGGAGPSAFAVKMPAVAGDLALAGVSVWLAGRLLSDRLRRTVPWRALVAAAILLNPAVIYVSAVWGQVDSLPAALVVAGLGLLATGSMSLRREAAGVALLALAVTTKPLVLLVAPAAIIVVVWRRLAAAEAGWAAAAREAGARVAVLGAVGIATGLALMAPFGMTPAEGWRFYGDAANTYRYTSVNAFNVWGAIRFWPAADVGPEAVRVLGVPAFWAGLVAFGGLTALVVVKAAQALRRGESDGRVAIVAGLSVTCGAFALLTRMHERYLFLALPLLAVLAAWRPFRRALIGLSVLFLVNLHFAYVSLNRTAGQKPLTLDGLFDFVYGTATDSAQKKLLSVVTAVACLAVGVRAWAWLAGAAPSRIGAMWRQQLARITPKAAVAALPQRPARAASGKAPPPADRRAAVKPKRYWILALHPVGRRGAALAFVVFAVVVPTRIAGLGNPPSMYFDEVYHARTGGEYLAGKEVYEWTHPPLAKEAMAASIRYLSAFRIRARGPAPEGLTGGIAASAGGGRVVWTTLDSPSAGRVSAGRFRDDCRVGSVGEPVAVPLAPAAVDGVGDTVVVGGVGETGPAVALVEGGSVRFVTPLPSVPVAVAALHGTSFVVTEAGSLLRIDEKGTPTEVGVGAASLDAVPDRNLVWVTFPDERLVAVYKADGVRDTTVELFGDPLAVAALPESDRVLVAGPTSVESIELPSNVRSATLEGGAERFGVVAGTGLVWAVSGGAARVLEPRGLTEIGRLELPGPATALLGDEANEQLVAVTPQGLACAAGRPAFAWRFGSAIAGAAAVALTLALGLRLFGSVLAALLAAAFMALDGLAFAMSRIAMNDSYVLVFSLAALFCGVSVLYRLGAADDQTVRSRPVALAWLAGCGLAGGLALASKWVGLYAIGAVVLLFAWDAGARRRAGILGIAGNPALSVGLVAAALVALPLGVYVASYVPYFSLGHSFGDLMRLQRGMYDYHSQLDASHPYGSKWFGWPFGYKAVWMYVGTRGAQRSEIWTVANPAVFLGGLAALVALARAAWRTHSAALALAPAAAIVVFAPWVVIGRVTFLYHYLPVVPFLALALGWWLAVERRASPRRRAVESGSVLAVALAVFLVTLPLTAGWFVSPGYQQGVRSFFGWMF